MVKIKKAETSTDFFVKYICKCKQMSDSSFSHRASPVHVRALLSSPRVHPFTPEESLYSSSVQYANSPQATQTLLIFSAASLGLFYEGFARAGRLFGFRKEKAQ